MPNIKIQFSTVRSVSAKILHWFDHGWCSHVATILPDGRYLSAELIGGVAIRTFKEEEFSKILIVELPTTHKIHDAFYAFCHSQVGKPYDWTAILAFAANREWRLNDAWFCSELISAALEVSQYFPYRIATGNKKITPHNLLLMLNMLLEIGVPQNVPNPPWVWGKKK